MYTSNNTNKGRVKLIIKKYGERLLLDYHRSIFTRWKRTFHWNRHTFLLARLPKVKFRKSKLRTEQSVRMHFGGLIEHFAAQPENLLIIWWRQNVKVNLGSWILDKTKKMTWHNTVHERKLPNKSFVYHRCQVLNCPHCEKDDSRFC